MPPVTLSPVVAPPPQGKVCTMMAAAGLSIHVFDKANKAALIGASVKATDEKGAQEVLFESSAGVYVGAFEHPGTFILSIEKDGYKSESLSGLVIEKDKDQCHVVPVQRDIELEK